MLRRLADLVLFRSQVDRSLSPTDRAGGIAPRDLEIGKSREAAMARELPLRPAAGARDDGAPHITTLSATGRFLAGLFGDRAAPPIDFPSDFPSPSARAARARAAPLQPAPPQDAAALAERLKSALAESGMFYESHQAQWVAGARPLEQLMREPQAQVAPLAPGAPEPVHSSLHDIVRQQIDALESGRLLWHGPMWPEQPLEWEIARQPSPGHGSSVPPAWKTSLRLTLPRLGEVGATLTIGADGIRIALAAGAAATAETLLARGDELRQALRAGGIGAVTLTIVPAATGGLQ